MKKARKLLVFACAIATMSALSISASAAPNDRIPDRNFPQAPSSVLRFAEQLKDGSLSSLLPSFPQRLENCPTPPKDDCDPPELERPENPKPETPKPENPKPETPKPENPKPETPKPENPKPETPKPETPKPETPKPENPKPENPKPENPRPETPETPNLSAFESEVVRLVNIERKKAGVKELTASADVTKAAGVRAQEQTVSFSHTRPDGSSCFTALTEAGVRYSGAGENIAYGQRTPEAVMQSWMNSPSHRDNILNPSFTTIGVGSYLKGSTYYWAQMFTY